MNFLTYKIFRYVILWSSYHDIICYDFIPSCYSWSSQNTNEFVVIIDIIRKAELLYIKSWRFPWLDRLINIIKNSHSSRSLTITFWNCANILRDQSSLNLYQFHSTDYETKCSKQLSSYHYYKSIVFWNTSSIIFWSYFHLGFPQNLYFLIIF